MFIWSLLVLIFTSVIFLLSCMLAAGIIYAILLIPTKIIQNVDSQDNEQEPVLTENPSKPETKGEPDDIQKMDSEKELVSGDPKTLSEEGFVPITVSDDEYIKPPTAKSKIPWEEDPADDDDIIKDKGEASYYENLSTMQEKLDTA